MTFARLCRDQSQFELVNRNTKVKFSAVVAKNLLANLKHLIKAYKTEDGRVLLFRPDKNIERANNSNRRLMIPELDVELDGGRQAQDEEERAAFYSEAQRILLEDLPITPLYYSELGIGVNTELVSGVELDPVGIIRLENVTAPE